MIKLYHAPRTRSMRIVWLLEELGIPYELNTVGFEPPSRPFSQHTPTGKFPTLEDGEVLMFESGAIAEHLLERYGNGRLAPAAGTPARAAFLQWMHFAEGAFVPFGNIAWHMLFKQDADRIPGAMEDYRGWARAALEVLERALTGKPYLLGDEFSAADIMMGYTVVCVRWFGMLGEEYPNLNAYMDRLEARPLFQKALAA
jgi:glutathione S-transferase